MSTFTENYNLIKPGGEDYYDVQDFNENMDTIDTQMMQTETEVAGLGEKIGNPAESGQTIFSLLEQVGNIQLVKSIQRLVYHNKTSSKTLDISPVNPSRCIVILERIAESYSSGLYPIDYVLSENHLTVNHLDKDSDTYYAVSCGFWIIEFY